MEKISLGRRRTRDGIHRPRKSTVRFDQKGLEPAADSMGTGVHEV